MGINSPFLYDLSKKATSAATFTAKTRLSNYGRLLRIKCISVSNNTTGAKVAHVGVFVGGRAYYFDTLVLTTASYFYSCYPDILIHSDYQIIIKAITPTQGDEYFINVIGEIVEQ